LIGGKPAARLGDATAHGGVVIAGCATVLIGSRSEEREAKAQEIERRLGENDEEIVDISQKIAGHQADVCGPETSSYKDIGNIVEPCVQKKSCVDEDGYLTDTDLVKKYDVFDDTSGENKLEKGDLNDVNKKEAAKWKIRRQSTGWDGLQIEFITMKKRGSLAFGV